MKARKPLALLLAMILLLAAAASPAAFADSAKDKTELIVFAAASMTETLTELKAKYEEANPDVTITCNFDSSGTLKTRGERQGEEPRRPGLRPAGQSREPVGKQGRPGGPRGKPQGRQVL